MSLSVAIDEAVTLAKMEGIGVREVSTGWTKMREVVHMNGRLTESLHARLDADHRLRAWSVEPTPHNKAENGFTDDSEQVAISFPS